MSGVSAQSGGWLSGALYCTWKGISEKVKDTKERQQRLKRERDEGRYEDLQREQRRMTAGRTQPDQHSNVLKETPKSAKPPVQQHGI